MFVNRNWFFWAARGATRLRDKKKVQPAPWYSHLGFQAELLRTILHQTRELAACVQPCKRWLWLQSFPVKAHSVFVFTETVFHISCLSFSWLWSGNNHPFPCMSCEKFLGFVSWIFHGKQNSIFLKHRRSFEMFLTGFGHLMGSVFCITSCPSVILLSKPQTLQPLACSGLWFDNPAIGGWSRRRSLIPLFVWFSPNTLVAYLGVPEALGGK